MHHLMQVLLLLVSTTIVVTSVNISATHKFLLMVANGSSPDSSAVVTAVNQTLEEINGDASILPGHRLHYILSDSQCNKTRALDSFFEVTSDNSVVAVVGCGCSSATEEVAKISHYSNIPVISYASTSVVLSDRSVYRSFFRTVPSDELLVSAVAAIMDSYGWRQLSMFTEEEPQFLELSSLLQQKLLPMVNISEGGCIHESDLLNYTQFADKISHVFDALPHIFIPVASHRAKTFILCSAFNNGRFYPNYAWILLGHHDTDWWREYYMETNCTDTEMRNVLNRTLVLTPYPDNNSNNNSDKNKYIEQIEQGDLYNVSAYASDAVRALAEELHNCFDSTGSGNISGSCRGALLNWNITFTGDTGLVRFSQYNGNRVASSTILQQFMFRGDRGLLKSVGLVVRSSNGTHQLTSIENTSVWPDGTPPDGTPVEIVYTLSTTTIVIQSLLAGVVLMAGMVSLCFSIIFRKRKIVKLTSPKLNYVLLIGVTLWAISALPYPSTGIYIIDLICVINYWFSSSLGYDICIAIALVKTWRVYYIFKNPSPDKRPPKDSQLLLAVLLFGVVEVVFAVPLLTLAFHNNIARAVFPNTLNEQGVLEIIVFIRFIQPIFHLVFLFLAVGYKFILHAIALVLAFLIRKVKVDVLNDSRETVVIICGSSVLLVAMSLDMVVQRDCQYDISIPVWFILAAFIIMIHLGLTFIPKMVALYKDPQGKNVFKRIAAQVRSSGTSGSNSNTTSTAVTEEDCDSELTILRERVTQLEESLKLYKEREEH